MYYLGILTMQHEVNNEPPRIIAEMVPFRARGLFNQADEMLSRIDPALQVAFRFGLAGHIHGPAYNDPMWEGPEGMEEDDPGYHEAYDAHVEAEEAADAERLEEVDIEQLRVYLNYWVTSASVIYRHFGGRTDSFSRAEALADEVLDDLHM
jgi:hypothetical protein